MENGDSLWQPLKREKPKEEEEEDHVFTGQWFHSQVRPFSSAWRQI